MLPRWVKPLLFVLCLLPLARMVWLVLQAVPVNPVEFITRSTGTWALVGLCLSLAISPLRRITGYGALLRVRRMVGLFAFFYAALHLLTYLWLDQFFDWAAILRDVLKRPFVTLGFAAFLLLLPLAVTSTDGWIRRLRRNWGRLHRLVYPAAVLAVLHYLWLVKRDLTEPLLYAAVLAVLLGVRIYWFCRARS
ncbi:sulfite oxidase heme-binding subunit YedZ [Chitinilyticum aquatile]|uniref:sulfite oxidase heme-binding subunit YedZ n=1 Tax=Chitinilyticum aquatile TaxID=362520 RepID=UPI0004096E8F|nr:protein-methionine-sulfoxide reductase heme-binding subunit MsrQ [Chitinilyticum aquatile]